MPALVIHKLADRTGQQRQLVFDPTGARKLVNPATAGVDHEPWPLAGVTIVGAPPVECSVPHNFVTAGIAEGWIVAQGEQVVTRPAGPVDDRWRTTHTFRQFDSITIYTLDGPVHYRVVHNPDKYVADGDDQTPMTDVHYGAGNSRVDWFYGLKLEQQPPAAPRAARRQRAGRGSDHG
jgi:hypothetical protein